MFASSATFVRTGPFGPPFPRQHCRRFWYPGFLALHVHWPFYTNVAAISSDRKSPKLVIWIVFRKILTELAGPFLEARGLRDFAKLSFEAFTL